MPIKHFSKAFYKLQDKIKDLQGKLSENEKEKQKLEKQVSLPQEDTTERVLVEISIWSTVKVIMVIFAAYLAFLFLERITSILILLFLASFFAITLNPGVDRLEKWKIPRGVGVIFWIILVVSLFLGILGGVIPIIAGEIAKMWAGVTAFAIQLSNEDFSALPEGMQEVIRDILPAIKEYFSQISPQELQNTIANFARDNLDSYFAQFGDIASKGLGLIVTFFGGIFQTLLVLILTFFLVVEKGNIGRFFVQLFPEKYKEYILQKASASQQKVADWVHGQITLFAIIGLIAYIGLSILGIEYALTLALIAGLAEFIPYVGPIIAFASAAPVAFNVSLSIGIATMIFYAALQAIEGNVIVPLVMKKAVGIPPVVTIISMLIGWEFLGIIGMILAVPVASVISLFVTDYSQHSLRKREEKRTEKGGK